MRLRSVLFIKVNENTPARETCVVRCFPVDHKYSPRELATQGYPILFGTVILDVTADEEVLANSGRRKVNSVSNPTALVSVD